MADKRMAGDYEIIQAMMIGDKEIVLGENPNDSRGLPYVCAYCEDDGIVVRFYDAIGGDDYCEIAQEFGQRIAEQAKNTRQSLIDGRDGLADGGIITAEQCDAIDSGSELNGKIIVIKPEALRREYRTANHQLKLCVGGFGASSNSRGSACFCTDLRTGKESRFERHDVLGTMEPEKLPQWAKAGLAAIRQAEINKGKNEREVR